MCYFLVLLFVNFISFFSFICEVKEKKETKQRKKRKPREQNDNHISLTAENKRRRNEFLQTPANAGGRSSCELPLTRACTLTEPSGSAKSNSWFTPLPLHPRRLRRGTCRSCESAAGKFGSAENKIKCPLGHSGYYFGRVFSLSFRTFLSLCFANREKEKYKDICVLLYLSINKTLIHQNVYFDGFNLTLKSKKIYCYDL